MQRGPGEASNLANSAAALTRHTETGGNVDEGQGWPSDSVPTKRDECLRICGTELRRCWPILYLTRIVIGRHSRHSYVIMSEQPRRSGKEVIEDGLKDGLNKLQRYIALKTVAPKVDLSG
jgi:hypothetical protein